ncbi:MAG: type II secretion system secretin GspD [Methylococcaceae bacterium]|nr:type II secretion system secretin GspD [Methylococcaceae bacterium]
MNSSSNRINFISLLVMSSLSLTACETLDKIHLGPKLGIKIPIDERLKQDDTPESLSGEQDIAAQEVIFSQLDNNDKVSADMPNKVSQTFIGSGQFTGEGINKSAIQADKEGKYSINFDAADIGEVCKIILSDMLTENYMLSPKVTGSVTLQTTKPLQRKDLLPTLEMLLRVNGAVMIKRDGVYRIEPDASGLHVADSSLLNSKKIGSGYQIKIIPLSYVGATDMAEIITPVVPSQAIIKVDPARNLLLVAGTHDELEKIIDLVNTFDVNFIAGMSFGLYPLENTEVESTVADIEKIFNKGEKTPLAGMLRFISIKHLNAILVITQQKAYLREAEKWIDRLDKQNGVIGEGGVIVYRVQHVDATDLAATLMSVINGGSTSASRPPSVAPGQTVASISNKTTTKTNTNTARAGSNATQGNAALEGVSIIADEPNNALIIMAEPQQYRMISKVIQHLDVMPLQVLLDATIVAVNLTENLEYGVKWLFKNSGPDGLEGVGLIGLAATGATAAASGGLSYGLTRGTDDIRMVFNALAEDNKINVLSAPSLMVLNNQDASIKVGDQVPIRTSESTNTNGGGINPIQTSPIQMVDTGVILNIKPRVNATGVVVLEIEQSVNTPQQNTASNIDSPAILKREIKSTVAVVNGESVILGGLISETHTLSNTGVPFLKDIPYVGWLFGTQGKKIDKSELIVVITPRVVVNEFDARKVTDEFKRKLTGIYYDKDEFTPGSGQTLRGYDGMAIQTEVERNNSMDHRLKPWEEESKEPEQSVN